MVKIMKRMIMCFLIILVGAGIFSSCTKQEDKMGSSSSDESYNFKEVKLSELISTKNTHTKIGKNLNYKDDSIIDIDKNYIYCCNITSAGWKYYRTKVNGNGKKEFFGTIPAKYDLKLMNVIKGKIYVGVVYWEKDGNQGYTIYRLEPKTPSKKVIFSNINHEMPDSFTCGDNIVTKIIKPLKQGVENEEIILINPDTGKLESLVKNSFKSNDDYKVNGKVLVGMDFHVNFNKNGFLYAMSNFKNTNLDGKSYKNTVYYYSLKKRCSIKLFNTNDSVSGIFGNINVLSIETRNHDPNDEGIYVKENGKYKKLNEIENLEDIKPLKNITKDFYYINDGDYIWFIDIKKHIYARVKTSYKETGTVVKNSRVITSKIKDGRFYLTEYKIKDN